MSTRIRLIRVYKGGPGSGHHNHRGIPGVQGGSLPGVGSGNVLPKEQRVWQGKQHASESKLSKLETGEIGEKLAARALADVIGTDFHSLNVDVNNMPIDLVGDHKAVEVKAGPANNASYAQRWRATIGQPGKAEQALLAQMSFEEKSQYNDAKQARILERKYGLLSKLSEQANGEEIQALTVGVIVAPDGSRGDVFLVPGFHLKLSWSQYATDEYYIGTYQNE